MFPAERQSKLNPVLDALRGLPGIVEVEQDDWNSYAINVFLTLQVAARGTFRSNDRPARFATPIRAIKASVKRACKQQEVDFDFLDWPSKLYEPDGMGGKLDDGYNHGSIKLEILV